MHERLLETLRDAQRFGFFGDRPIEDAVRHAQGFVEAIGDIEPGTTIVDLGSGGGLPGLVVADHYPTARVLLVDRRAKRTDFLRRAVRRLRWEHVEVTTGDVVDLVSAVEDGAQAHFEVVTARGFGPPMVTLELARRLTGPGGRIVISEPPDDDRWEADSVASLGLRRRRIGPVSRFDVR